MEAKKIVKRWTVEYMAVVQAGWESMTVDVKSAFKSEDQAAIIRGMMVDAAKCGIVPSATDIIEMLAEQPDERKAESTPMPEPPQLPPAPLSSESSDTKKETKQEMTDFEGKKTEAFDRNKPGWVCCPNCGSVDIHHISEKDGKKRKFCACYDCGIFLNIDSKCQPSIKEMEPK